MYVRSQTHIGQMGIGECLKVLRGHIGDARIATAMPSKAGVIMDSSIMVHTLLSRHYGAIMIHDDWSDWIGDYTTEMRRWATAGAGVPVVLCLFDGRRLVSKIVNKSRADVREKVESAARSLRTAIAKFQHVESYSPPVKAGRALPYSLYSPCDALAARCSAAAALSTADRKAILQEAVHGRAIDAVPIAKGINDSVGALSLMAATETDAQAVFDANKQPWRLPSSAGKPVIVGYDSDLVAQQHGAVHLIFSRGAACKRLVRYLRHGQFTGGPTFTTKGTRPEMDGLIESYGFRGFQLWCYTTNNDFNARLLPGVGTMGALAAVRAAREKTDISTEAGHTAALKVVAKALCDSDSGLEAKAKAKLADVYSSALPGLGRGKSAVHCVLEICKLMFPCMAVHSDTGGIVNAMPIESLGLQCITPAEASVLTGVSAFEGLPAATVKAFANCELDPRTMEPWTSAPDTNACPAGGDDNVKAPMGVVLEVLLPFKKL